MTIEEVKEKKHEMEQKISATLKEFEEATKIQVKIVYFSRCTKSDEFGVEEDYSYNVEVDIKL